MTTLADKIAISNDCEVRQCPACGAHAVANQGDHKCPGCGAITEAVAKPAFRWPEEPRLPDVKSDSSHLDGGGCFSVG